MESKTPRTDAEFFRITKYEQCFDVERRYEVVNAKFAEQLETELADARAEIEKLKVWLNENHAMDAMTIRNHARTIEKRDEEITAKNKLIERMRGALKACEEKICHGVWSDGNDPEPMHKLLDALEAAERGE